MQAIHDSTKYKRQPIDLQDTSGNELHYSHFDQDGKSRVLCDHNVLSELARDLKRAVGQTNSTRKPDIVARVSSMKLLAIMSYLKDDKLFANITAKKRVVKFQECIFSQGIAFSFLNRRLNSAQTGLNM